MAKSRRYFWDNPFLNSCSKCSKLLFSKKTVSQPETLI